MPREKMMIGDMTVGEVEQRVLEIKKELFNLKFRNSMQQQDNPLEIRYLKRDLARLKTALSAHRIGLYRLPGDATETTPTES